MLKHDDKNDHSDNNKNKTFTDSEYKYVHIYIDKYIYTYYIYIYYIIYTLVESNFVDTHDTRLPPWAEFSLLHLKKLSPLR